MKKSLAGLVVFLSMGIFIRGQQPQNIQKWTLGALTGPSIFELYTPGNVTNPVLSPEAVNDFKVDILAHPYFIKVNSNYYLFFTAKDKATDTGGIGMAESKDGLVWKYRKMVLQDPVIHSHPLVFKWKNDFYLIPETNTDSCVRLYKAVEFPDKWALEGTLLKGDDFISPTVFQYKNMWWMFTSPKGNANLRLFYADELKGPWTEHPQSPVVENNPSIARPAGRTQIIDNKLYRMGMDNIPNYGYQVHAFQITKLTKTAYEEKMIATPIIKATGEGWNARAMHHIDAIKVSGKKWIAVVDALGF